MCGAPKNSEGIDSKLEEEKSGLKSCIILNSPSRALFAEHNSLISVVGLHSPGESPFFQ